MDKGVYLPWTPALQHQQRKAYCFFHRHVPWNADKGIRLSPAFAAQHRQRHLFRTDTWHEIKTHLSYFINICCAKLGKGTYLSPTPAIQHRQRQVSFTYLCNRIQRVPVSGNDGTSIMRRHLAIVNYHARSFPTTSVRKRQQRLDSTLVSFT